MKEYETGLIGRTLGHSWSPEIHALIAPYRYELVELEENEVEDFIRHGVFRAMNVTIPYKKTALACCDVLSETARAIGSVNVLKRLPDGRLFGDNTDPVGFEYLIKSAAIDPSGRKVLVLGSGGASLTVQYVMHKYTDRVIVISRSGEDNYENLSRHADADIIVNTTPVGMFPNNGVSPVDLSLFPRVFAAVDLIYNPIKTAFLLQAEARGIKAVNGLSMLVNQACASYERFFDAALPQEKCEEILQSLTAEKRSLVLIGMPGCGKSSVGKILAKLTRKKFADCDAALEEDVGQKIPEILKEKGEAYFRDLETKTLERLTKQGGTVLATGGGCVTRAENKALLQQNALVIYLDRPLKELPTNGRPLSQSDGLEKLYLQRRENYESWSDIRVSSRRDPYLTARAILSALKKGKH